MNTHLQRIRILSRFLKWLCLTVMAFFVFTLYLIATVPIVSVGAAYRNPALPPPGPEVRQVEPATPANEFDGGSRTILELAENKPALRNFSYFPGPSNLRPEREWVARSITALYLLYGFAGPFLFFQLFKRYEQGAIFELAAIRKLKWIGLWTAGLLVINFGWQLCKPLWTQSGATMSFELNESLFIGLFIWVIASIMEEARHLSEEQALTV